MHTTTWIGPLSDLDRAPFLVPCLLPLLNILTPASLYFEAPPSCRPPSSLLLRSGVPLRVGPLSFGRARALQGPAWGLPSWRLGSRGAREVCRLPFAGVDLVAIGLALVRMQGCTVRFTLTSLDIRSNDCQRCYVVILCMQHQA
eukprot:7210647-Pyramimonas_sp.AAC.1